MLAQNITGYATHIVWWLTIIIYSFDLTDVPSLYVPDLAKSLTIEEYEHECQVIEMKRYIGLTIAKCTPWRKLANILGFITQELAEL